MNQPLQPCNSENNRRCPHCGAVIDPAMWHIVDAIVKDLVLTTCQKCDRRLVLVPRAAKGK